MLDRRTFIGLMTSVAMTGIGSAARAQSRMQDMIRGIAGSGKNFSRNVVLDVARELAKQPFVAPAVALPDPFNGLNLEQFSSITPKPETAIWAGENRGFTVEPLHRGYVFDVPVLIYTVADDMVLNISYDQNRFQMGKLVLPASLPDIGYSGIRINVIEDGASRELAVFQGATFFRSRAKWQTRGVMARAVSIKTGDQKGEEISQFRAFWIERPPLGGPMVLHAIADSETVVAAFRFSIRPGDITIIDTEVTLLTRAPLDNIGFGGMQTMHFFSPASPRRAIDDYRASAHESSGLQIQRGNGEWVWRPLNNPGQLQVSSFLDDNIKGFGLAQRNRDYANFQDDDQKFELRPTCWVEPLGEWGMGAVQLIEIPTEADQNQNIVAYWRPKAPMVAGQEISIAYRQFWCWQVPEQPPIGMVTSTRIGRTGSKRRHFAVDFSSPNFVPDQKPENLTIKLSNNNLGIITGVRTIYYPERKTVRVTFDLDPGNETLIELRLLLETAGKPETETWLYRWTPQ